MVLRVNNKSRNIYLVICLPIQKQDTSHHLLKSPVLSPVYCFSSYRLSAQCVCRACSNFWCYCCIASIFHVLVLPSIAIILESFCVLTHLIAMMPELNAIQDTVPLSTDSPRCCPHIEMQG